MIAAKSFALNRQKIRRCRLAYAVSRQDPRHRSRVIRYESEKDQEHSTADPTCIGKCQRLREDTDPDQYGDSVEHLQAIRRTDSATSLTMNGNVRSTYGLPAGAPPDFDLSALDILYAHAHLSRLQDRLFLSSRAQSQRHAPSPYAAVVRGETALSSVPPNRRREGRQVACSTRFR
jgi:hypothetical protein